MLNEAYHHEHDKLKAAEAQIQALDEKLAGANHAIAKLNTELEA